MQFVDPYSKTHVNQKNNRISLTEMKRMGLEKANRKNFFESIIPLSNAPFHYILDGSKHSESEILGSYLNNPVKYSAIKINANIEAQDTTLLKVAEMIKKIDGALKHAENGGEVIMPGRHRKTIRRIKKVERRKQKNKEKMSRKVRIRANAL